MVWKNMKNVLEQKSLETLIQTDKSFSPVVSGITVIFID